MWVESNHNHTVCGTVECLLPVLIRVCARVRACAQNSSQSQFTHNRIPQEGNRVLRSWCGSFCSFLDIVLVLCLENQMLQGYPDICDTQEQHNHTSYLRDKSFDQRYGAGLLAEWSRVRNAAGAGNFSLYHCFQTGSGTHPAPIQWIPGALSLGVKLTTHLHLVPRSSMGGVITSFPQYAFLVWCSVKAKGQLYFDLYILAVK
jgi:hypothetical protein